MKHRTCQRIETAVMLVVSVALACALSALLQVFLREVERAEAPHRACADRGGHMVKRLDGPPYCVQLNRPARQIAPPAPGDTLP